MHDDELDSTAIDAAERINDALDAIAQGASPAFHLHRLDDATARTIDQFQKLASHAGAPVPAESFVNKLREDLMLTSPTALPTGATKPTASGNRSGAIRRHPETPSRRGAFETAAAVLLVCALMFGAFATGEGPKVLNFVGITSQETANEAIMWGGDPGQTWNLSSTDPEPGSMPHQIVGTDPANEIVLQSALVVGNNLIRSSGNTFGEDLTLSSVDLHTAKKNWSVPAKTWGTMASDGERVYVFTLDSKRVTRLKPRLTAFSLKTGEELWVGSELPQLSIDIDTYGPILMDGILYAQDALGDIVAVDSVTGNQIWQYPEEFFPAVGSNVTSSSVPSSSMIGIDNAIYVVTASKTLVKLDRQTGKELSSTNLTDRFGTDVRSVTIVAVGNDLLVRLLRAPLASSDNGKVPEASRTTMARLSGVDLSTSWSQDLGGIASNIVSTETAIYFAGQLTVVPNGNPYTLVELDAQSGKPSQDWADDAISFDRAQLSVAGETLMALGNTNQMSMFDLSTKKQLEILQVPIETDFQGFYPPPLLWGNVPVVAMPRGSVWTFPKEIASPSTSVLLPSETPVGRATPTLGASSSLSPNSATLTIQVYVDGVLNDDPAAIATARAELDRVLAPYVNGSNCQIGFALITSRSFDVSQDVQLSDAIAKMIQTDHPDLLPVGADGKPSQLVSESIAQPGTTRLGEVQLQLFLNMGCQPAPATPVATPVAP